MQDGKGSILTLTGRRGWGSLLTLTGRKGYRDLFRLSEAGEDTGISLELTERKG
jgi:hypothetical protein